MSEKPDDHKPTTYRGIEMLYQFEKLGLKLEKHRETIIKETVQEIKKRILSACKSGNPEKLLGVVLDNFVETLVLRLKPPIDEV